MPPRAHRSPHGAVLIASGGRGLQSLYPPAAHPWPSSSASSPRLRAYLNQSTATSTSSQWTSLVEGGKISDKQTSEVGIGSYVLSTAHTRLRTSSILGVTMGLFDDHLSFISPSGASALPPRGSHLLVSDTLTASANVVLFHLIMSAVQAGVPVSRRSPCPAIALRGHTVLSRTAQSSLAPIRQ